MSYIPREDIEVFPGPGKRWNLRFIDGDVRYTVIVNDIDGGSGCEYTTHDVAKEVRGWVNHEGTTEP